MKILIIHGSPRKKNTWDLLNIVKDKLNAKMDINYELIELNKAKLDTCKGCFNCIFRGEDKCPHSSTMKSLIDKIDNCDAMIMTSPVYSLQISGLLKNFIDHMSYNFHRPKYFNKKALIIITTAGAGEKESANYLKKVLQFWGLSSIYTIAIKYRNKIEDVDYKRIDKEINKFASDLINERTKSPSLKQVCMYNSWRAMSAFPYKEGSADYDYWQISGLNRYTYSPDVEISKYKSIIGKITYKGMYKIMNKNNYDNKDIKD